MGTDVEIAFCSSSLTSSLSFPFFSIHNKQNVQAFFHPSYPLLRCCFCLCPSRTSQQDNSFHAIHRSSSWRYVLGGWVPTIQGFGTNHVQDAIRPFGNDLHPLFGIMRLLLCPIRSSSTRTWRSPNRILGQVVLCPRIFRRSTRMGNPRRCLDPTQKRNVNAILYTPPDQVLNLNQLENRKPCCFLPTKKKIKENAKRINWPAIA